MNYVFANDAAQIAAVNRLFEYTLSYMVGPEDADGKYTSTVSAEAYDCAGRAFYCFEEAIENLYDSWKILDKCVKAKADGG